MNAQVDVSLQQEDLVEYEEETDAEAISFASSYESEDDDRDLDDDSYSNADANQTRMTVANKQWKPRSDTTYETLVLTKSEFNSKVRGAGFREDGRARHIKFT